MMMTYGDLFEIVFKSIQTSLLDCCAWHSDMQRELADDITTDVQKELEKRGFDIAPKLIMD